eukprot:EG_transcript_12796
MDDPSCTWLTCEHTVVNDREAFPQRTVCAADLNLARSPHESMPKPLLVESSIFGCIFDVLQNPNLNPCNQGVPLKHLWSILTGRCDGKVLPPKVIIQQDYGMRLRSFFKTKTSLAYFLDRHPTLFHIFTVNRRMYVSLRQEWCEYAEEEVQCRLTKSFAMSKTDWDKELFNDVMKCLMDDNSMQGNRGEGGIPVEHLQCKVMNPKRAALLEENGQTFYSWLARHPHFHIRTSQNGCDYVHRTPLREEKSTRQLKNDLFRQYIREVVIECLCRDPQQNATEVLLNEVNVAQAALLGPEAEGSEVKMGDFIEVIKKSDVFHYNAKTWRIYLRRSLTGTQVRDAKKGRHPHGSQAPNKVQDRPQRHWFPTPVDSLKLPP